MEERRALKMAHQAELDHLGRAHSQALADKEAVPERNLEEARMAREAYKKQACTWSVKEQGMLQEAGELDQLLGREFLLLVCIYLRILGTLATCSYFLITSPSRGLPPNAEAGGCGRGGLPRRKMCRGNPDREAC